jgi:hypothetical protein
MPCYRPLTAFRSKDIGVSGKRKMVFKPELALGYGIGLEPIPQLLACGQCIGCRILYSGNWAVRGMHEASLYTDNSFITLTYDDEHLPSDMSLSLRHHQLFMKRLRKLFSNGITLPNGSVYQRKKIRFFHCGEYGDKLGRPHYHTILFNLDFPDKTLHMERDGNKIYTSDILSKLWSEPRTNVPYGFVTIGSVTFQSIAYVARYCMKKITGERAEAHYTRVDANTGEVIHLKPEYVTMSRRPGVGKEWFEKFGNEVIRDDFVIMNGNKVKPPRYYDSQFELLNPEGFEAMKLERRRVGRLNKENNTPERLRVREIVKKSKFTILKRELE